MPMWMYGDSVDEYSGVVDVKRHKEEVIHLQAVLESTWTQQPGETERVWPAGPPSLCPSGTL